MSVMEELNNHKVAIVIIAGVGIGLYLLTSKSGAAPASGTSSGASSGSGTGYTNSLNQQYQNQLMSQALSNQAQLQSESVAGATQVGLSQQRTARQGQNLAALTYTGLGIDQVLMNQNSNQAQLYSNQGAQLTGQGASAFNPIMHATISNNQMQQSFGTGSFSGFGMNIHSGNGMSASGG